MFCFIIKVDFYVFLFRSKYFTRDNIVDIEKKTETLMLKYYNQFYEQTGCCNCCIVVETEATVPKYHICYETVAYTCYVQVQY